MRKLYGFNSHRGHVKQTAAQKRKEQSRRNNVVHGWAFRDHTPEEKEAIQHYINTGEVTENFPSNYKHLNEVL